MTPSEENATSPLAWVVDRLYAAEGVPEPYPHYYLENVFPRAFYQSLLSNLPDSAVYQNLFEVTDLKLDHFRQRDQRDMKPGWTDGMPETLKDFWDRFSPCFLGPALAQAVLRSFSEPLRERLGDEERWPAVSVEAQIIRH